MLAAVRDEDIAEEKVHTMYTSQSSYSQKLYAELVAFMKLRSVSCLLISSAARLSLWRIHFSTRLSLPVGCCPRA